jgi:hypothetical protein
MELAKAVYEMTANFPAEQRSLFQAISLRVQDGMGQRNTSILSVCHVAHSRTWELKCNLQSCSVLPLPIMPRSILLITPGNC